MRVGLAFAQKRWIAESGVTYPCSVLTTIHPVGTGGLLPNSQSVHRSLIVVKIKMLDFCYFSCPSFNNKWISGVCFLI